MTTTYLQLSSSYRNRNQYPLASDFVARMGTSGAPNGVTAVDPISDAAPIKVFIPFLDFSGTIDSETGGFGTETAGSEVIVQFAAATDISRVENYYAGIVMRFAAGDRIRIIEDEYLFTTLGGDDVFRFRLDGQVPDTAVGGTAVNFYDPSEFTDSSNLLLFIPESPPIEGYYNNYIIFNETQNQWLPIERYNGTLHTVRLVTATGGGYVAGTWSVLDSFVLRRAPPIEYGLSITSATSTTATIPSAQTINNYYVGSFIRIVSSNEMRRITAYNAATTTVTVSPAFSSVPAGAYEILFFTRDNESTFTYSGSRAAETQPVDYEASLLQIILPSDVIISSYGGTAASYPFVYVSFLPITENNQNGYQIVSNNPNARGSQFIAMLTDSSGAEVTPFVRLNGNGMVQRIKLRPGDDYRFSVRLPDGTLYDTRTVEQFSPLAPEATGQIDAIFQLVRV